MSVSPNADKAAQAPALSVWYRRVLPLQRSGELTLAAGVGTQYVGQISPEMIATGRLDNEEPVFIATG